ncbi:RING finger protein 212B-like isoform X2 [Solea solea]|uniref:RING finger protein 212B-like isoform X2 n=1 Tax=Solea solea TaxID=90069 RepID=UPI00272BAE02|nr:RING finger protein 212B-like isoform X2 [Solea solea]
MDWFHCNKCFTRRAASFAVSSCGHICCESCITSKQCSVCGSDCRYLPITDKMKPQEKVFFKDPVKLMESRLAHILQIALFQQKQMERIAMHLKHKSVELERRLKEVTEQGDRQLSELERENGVLKKQLLELKRENAKLKKPLSQRRVSPGQLQTDGAQKMTFPVAVTSRAQLSPRGGPETEVPVSPLAILLDQLPRFPAMALFLNMCTEHPQPSAPLQGLSIRLLLSSFSS